MRMKVKTAMKMRRKRMMRYELQWIEIINS